MIVALFDMNALIMICWSITRYILVQRVIKIIEIYQDKILYYKNGNKEFT